MVDDVNELPESLRALGRGLTVTVPDDLAERVLAGIARAPVRRGVRWRRWVGAIAALVLAGGVSTAVSAPVRAAFIRVLEFSGIEVRDGPGPAPAPSPLLPGEHRTDIDSAEREVGFPIRIPATLGTPESVTVADGRVVSLHYGQVRIDEFAGTLGTMWTKYADMAAQRTTVGGHDALWFDQPVILVYIDADGAQRNESTRLTDGTLVWTDGGVTFRLDGIRPLDAARTVARSMS